QRIRINRQQRRHCKHVSRRFQDPAPASSPKLQMLKKTTVIFVCRPQILPKEPRAVRWHIIHRIELIALKCRRHEADALLRNFSTDRVHVAERRYDPVKEVTTLGRALNSAFFIVASRRGWRPNFPHKGRSMFRVCSE